MALKVKKSGCNGYETAKRGDSAEKIRSIMASMKIGFLQFRCTACLIALAVLTVESPNCQAEDSDQKSLEYFERHVRPTLVDHCIRCHGPEKQQGGLRLDTARGLTVGGDSGAAVAPGESESLILRAIGYQDRDLQMPPRGKLSNQTIEGFRAWIESGALDPRTDSSSIGKNASIGMNAADVPGQGIPPEGGGRLHWSFQPIAMPAAPDVNNPAWPKTDIDRFILARLESQGLSPVADAEPVVLLRRLYFDLIGLPPTPEQIEDFLRDRSPTAYEDLVDRLLESHHFGERWARHWLDVVRFAESSGGGRTLIFPDAWRYRDYVIDSFNRDVPYNQFLTEQLAGDLLECRDWEQQRRNLIATAFLLLGPTNYEMQDKDVLEMDVVDEQLDTMGKSMLGMTIGCARCHDHKFDPIPASDYYAMAGILKSTRSLIHSNVSRWNTTELPLPDEEQAAIREHEARLAAAKARLKAATKRWRAAGGKPRQEPDSKSIALESIAGIVVDDTAAELTGEWTESTSIPGFVGERYIHDATAKKGQKSVVYQPSLRSSGNYEVLISYSASSNRSTRVPVRIHHNGGETLMRINQRQRPNIDDRFVSLGTFALDSENQPRVVISNEGTDDGVVIADAVVFFPDRRQGQSLLLASRHQSEGSSTTVLAELKQAMDQLAAEVKSLEQAAPIRSLVMAVADDENTSDIHLAIRGQIRQPGPRIPRGVMKAAAGNLFPTIQAGQSGRKELADWIADPRHPLTSRVFVNRLWHWLFGRGIVSTVDNFGSMGERPTHPELLDHLASTFTQQGWSIKSLVREMVLSRVYRLSSASDERSQRIDPENRLLWRMHRKRLRAEDIRDSLLLVSGSLDLSCGGPTIKPGTTSEYGYSFTSTRRSVYVPVFRNALPEIFEVFDFADPNIQRGRRSSSTVAPQALLLMNHPLVIEQCQRAADVLLAGQTSGTPARARHAYLQVRHAYLQVLGRPPNERELSVAVDFVTSGGENGDPAKRWALLYQLLFQCIDFRYLD